MKKLVSIIAIVLAFTMLTAVSAFAADPAFAVAEDAVIPEGTTVTPAADSIAVTTAATAGNYYGVLLVEGNALPTVDNAILYINQATAADVAQAFEVLPNMAGLEDGTELTLYISSNVAGAELIAIPMVYAAEEDGPVYLIADVDGDGEQALLPDAIEIINYVNWEVSTLDSMDEAAIFGVAEIDGDGEAALLPDAIEIINYVNWEPSALDNVLGI